MTPRILIRADSGAGIGSGHLVRCLALADEFSRRGSDIAFVCLDRPRALLSLPRQAGCALRVLPPSTVSQDLDAVLTAQFADEWEADLIVVDHYGIDERWENALRGPDRYVLAIDDLADRHHACEWLLDQNDCWPEAQRYDGLVPARCKQLLGPRFALVRPTFAAARERVMPRDGRLRDLVVFFSGSDDTNETAKALRGLALLGEREWSVDVVVGSAHPDRAGIAELCRRHGWRYHEQVDYMAELFARADLCLGSAGSASWERCVVGSPALLVELSPDQRSVIEALVQQGCAKSVGDARETRPEDYAHALSNVSADELAAMSRAAWDWVDGQGARRAADVILETMSEA